jgi:hypothetical protein
VNDQTVNQTAKPLKKGKNKQNKTLFRNSRITVLVVLVLLLEHPVLSVSPRQFWSTPVVGGWWVGSGGLAGLRSFRAVFWWACHVGA